jgi:cellulose synthase/poly-beta-1,6-N-acetylglucosamine synthase-like glycosyltransferase
MKTTTLERSNYSEYVAERRNYQRSTSYAQTMPRRLYVSVGRVGQIEVLIDRSNALDPSRGKLALLIAGHNEELVIEHTLRSAIAAGMRAQDIYVVDDNSDDATSQIAISVVGEQNVLRVDRSGKGLALTKGAAHFKLTQRYQWIHIADADGGFATSYFDIFKGRLNPRYAAATGYVRSLPGSTIGQYRVFEYTIGMEIHRRFQAMTNTVSVIPGPTSCFRADVFQRVNFANKSITEDFDVTIQIHRQKLGKIQFIPQAVAYTQDPKSLKDFTKQITRWNRGVMQGIRRHRIGLRATRLDAYLSYQILQNFMLLFNYGFILPYMAVTRHSLDVIATAFLLDVTILFAIIMAVVLRTGRTDILSAFPQIYIYRFVTLYVFVKEFVNVMVLGKYRVTEGIWGTTGRRFKNPATA